MRGRVDIEAWQLAEEMVAEGLRPPLVEKSTGIPLSVIRRMWKQRHGSRPPSGLFPVSCASVMSTPTKVLEANLFLGGYALIGGQSILLRMDPRVFIRAWRWFRAHVSDPEIGITTAWLIGRDLRSRIMGMKHCRTCGLHYLFSLAFTNTLYCPFCRFGAAALRQAS